jgi:3-deoxy-D-manno-octulosonate 8-phosphate phosphatase (KDO 8-P phosphatase)
MTHASPFAPALLLRAQGQGLGMRCAFFDVDGVLTDGRIYVGEQGETFKAFSTLDGQGLKLLVQAGITPVIITGRDSPAVRRRVTELGLKHAHYGVHDKLTVATAVLEQLGVAWADAAAMGDDWPDLPLLRCAGFACAPANAHREAKALAHRATATAGGHGAARELCDILLMASGAYARLLQAQTGTLDHGGAA